MLKFTLLTVLLYHFHVTGGSETPMDDNSQPFMCNSNISTLSAGKYMLTNTCIFDSIDNVVLSGEGSNNTIINCTGEGSITFRNANKFTVSNLTITNCGTLGSNRSFTSNFPLPHALMKHKIALLLINCSNVTISNLHMTHNPGLNLVGINVFGNSTMDGVVIDNIVSNTNENLTSSAALFEFRISPNVLNDSFFLFFKNCYFHDNNNWLPDSTLFGLNNYIVPLRITKTVNIPVVAAGLSIGFLQNGTYSATVSISHTNFTNNHGRLGGGMFVAFANPINYCKLTIDNCLFEGNVIDKEYIQASNGAGLLAASFFYERTHHHNHSDQHYNFLHISNTRFINNSAVVGTCIYLYLFVNGLHSAVTLDNVTFDSNKGDVATAMYAEDHILYQKQSSIFFNLTNIRATNNTLVNATGEGSKPISTTNGLIVFFSIQNVKFYGDSNIFSYNTPGAIGLSNTDINFDGNFFFINNTAPTYGGAVYLTAGSTMVIASNSSLLFQYNVAGKQGGAICSQSKEGLAQLSATCPIQFKLLSNYSLNVTFLNNSAPQGGNSIFASHFYPCGWFPQFGVRTGNDIDVLKLYRKVFTFHPNYTKQEIVSTANTVCFCDDSSSVYCHGTNLTVQPGVKMTLKFTVVDSKMASVHSSIHLISPDSNSTVNPDRLSINVGCTEVNVTFYGTVKQTANFTVRPTVPVYTKGVGLMVNFTDCPIGLVQKKGSNTCSCNKHLAKKRFCSNSTNTLIIPQGGWMNIFNKNRSLYFSPFCDIAYCLNRQNVSFIEGKDNRCKRHRHGILCGQCKANFSAVLGSNDCLHCHNYSLVTIIGYLVVGIFLVISLSLLKFTVDKGTINGVIFYANIIYINRNLFYAEEIYGPPQIINMLNLDPPVGTCLYKGMTTLVKNVLEFLFPLYLWLLTGALVLLIKKFPSVSRVFHSPSQLLATLVYLSYSKLLQAISFIVTPVTVSVIRSGNNDVTTYAGWYYDANIRYDNFLHLILVIVSLLIFLILFLPFTIILTFPNYFLGYRYVVHFKPIIDSYTAPYKDRWGFWLGVHLLLLILFYIFSMIPEIDRRELMLIILLFLVILTAVQLYFQPYKSKWINFLDTLFLINLQMSACVLLLIVKKENGFTLPYAYFSVTVYFFLTVAVLEMIVIVSYHIILVTCMEKFLIMINKMYWRLRLCCGMQDTMLPDSINEDSYHRDIIRYSDSRTPLLVNLPEAPPRFRESFLDYDNLITPRSQS
ncbi:uncharacterized protein [Dysidea avara]|uniref:uncharacterized protein n=1 Tax=Dysidea avara TaxID=196820 RepID=UPI003320A91B